ncbi:MAG: hypothetical protein JWR14_6270 [Caballeronia sp.]|jgi:hypothetical protein|nr:hypothetical protein [Caballeronia sp.]
MITVLAIGLTLSYVQRLLIARFHTGFAIFRVPLNH